MSQVLDPPTAAQYLQTSERHLRRLVADKKITYTKVGRKVRFLQEDLDTYLSEHRVVGS